MIVGTSQVFLDYNWGILGHLPYELTMESEWSLGHSWLRMSLHGSLLGSTRLQRQTFQLTLRRRLLEASLLEFGVTPRRRHPRSRHGAHNGGTTCANYNRHWHCWHWFGNDMKWPQQKTALSGYLLDDHTYPRNAHAASKRWVLRLFRMVSAVLSTVATLHGLVGEFSRASHEFLETSDS